MYSTELMLYMGVFVRLYMSVFVGFVLLSLTDTIYCFVYYSYCEICSNINIESLLKYMKPIQKMKNAT